MPGGLAAWLDDPIDTKLKPKREKNVLQHIKLHRGVQPREATAAAAAATTTAAAAAARQPLTATATDSPNFPIIDVDAVMPCASAVGPGKTTSLASSSSSSSSSSSTTPKRAATLPAKAPWDPFASEERHAPQDDAFARLLQGRPSSKLKAARSAGVSPSLSTGSSPGSAPWDPFASSGEGKENGGDNAFSRLLASPGQGASGKGRSVLVKGQGARSSSSAGKRKRPVGSSPMGASTSAGMGEDAATRFCDCPVCGKRVIIELCSKHLDTECRGSDTITDLSSSPPPSAPTDRPHQKSSPIPSGSSTAACAPSSSRSSTRQRDDTPARLPPPRTGGVTRNGSDGIEQKGNGGHATPTPAVKTPPVIDALSGTGTPTDGTPTDGGSENSRKKARRSADNDDAVRRTSSSPAPASASGGGLKLPAPRRKTARGSSGTAAAAAAAAAGLSQAVISCPVCAQKVRADLCSRHLDTDCAGMSAADPPVLDRSQQGGGAEVERGGGARVEGGGGAKVGERGRVKVGGGGGASDGAAAEAKREKAASETAGGLTALGAELTCPVCLCVFEDAHTLPCSHRFCLECITGCFRSSKRQECPLCKVPAWKRDLKRDVPLQNIIVAYRRMTA